MTTTGERDAGRRYLLTTAVCRHRHQQDWDRPELTEDLDRITTLFTRHFGYTHVPVLGVDPTKADLLRQLRAFCTSPERRRTDYLVVYFAGHGEVREATGEHLLVTADTDPADLAFTGLRTEELGRVLVDETEVRRILLILDTCDSGSGGAQVAASAVVMDPSWRESDDSRGLVVVSSSQPYQLAMPGAFTRRFTRAVQSLASAGSAPDVLQIGAVVDVMRGTGKPEAQQVVWDAVRMTGELPAFLPNPRRADDAGEIDGVLRSQADQRVLRAREFRQELLPKARAGVHDDGWHFTGRHGALRTLSTWLRTARAPQPDTSGRGKSLLLTGGPGSGKSAVLGLLAASAHPDWGRAVPWGDLGLPQDALPPTGAIDAAVYARGATEADVLAAIAAAAGTRAGSAGALIEHLRRWDEPVTVVVDALDEAADPAELVGRVLRPLQEHGAGNGLRLLVGTRPHLLPLFAPGTATVDLDAPEYLDPDAVRTHVERTLRAAAHGTPFAAADRELVASVAGAVADAAGRSFLVARIITQTLLRSDRLPDPSDLVWRGSLPKLPGEAMRRDLEQRFGEDARRVVDLLLPLAYAEGQGLPWENLWAPLASAIAGTPYRDEDIVWLRERSGSYLVEDTFAGRSVYRIFHQALTEYVRTLKPAGDVHAAITGVLRASVGSLPGGESPQPEDWRRAHPYIRHHLAAHAAAGGQLGPLAGDPHFLLAAEPERLRRALVAADMERSAGATAYQEYSLQQRGDSTPEQLSYLLLAARRAGAATLIRRIEESTSRPSARLPWTTLWAWRDPNWRVRRILQHRAEVVRMTPAEDGRLLTLDATGVVREWPPTAEAAEATGVVDMPTAAWMGVGAAGDATVAAWDGDEVVLRGALTGEPLVPHSRLVLPPHTGTGSRERGPLASLDTARGRYVAALCYEDRHLGTPQRPCVRYAVYVWFLPCDGGPPQRFVRVRDYRIREFCALALVEDASAGVTVVVADTHGVSNRRIRIDQARLMVWHPATQSEYILKEPEGASFFSLHMARATACAAARIGAETLVALGTSKGHVMVWRLRDRKRLRSTQTGAPHAVHPSHAGLARGPVTALTLDTVHGRPVLVCGHAFGRVEMLRVDSGAGHPLPFPTGGQPITSLAVLDGRQLSIATQGGEVLVCDVPALSSASSTARRQLAVAAADGASPALGLVSDAAGRVEAFEVSDGKPYGRLESPTGAVVSLLPLPTATRTFAYLTEGGDRPGLWRPDDPTGGFAPRHGGDDRPAEVGKLALVRADTVLAWTPGASTRSPQQLRGRMWRLGGADSAEPVPESARRTLPGLSANATVLASASGTVRGRTLTVFALERPFGRTLQLWDVGGTGTLLGSLRLGRCHPSALAVGATPEGAAVVVGDSEGGVVLYDAQQLRPLPMLPERHATRVRTVALGAEGSCGVLASADEDGILHLTPLSGGAPVTLALDEPILTLAVGEGATVLAVTDSGAVALTCDFSRSHRA